MTEHEYQMQDEKLHGSIRIERIKQRKFEVEGEKEKTKQSMHGLNTEKQKTLDSAEDTKIAGLKVEGKRRDATLLRHQNVRKNLDASHQNKENTLYGKTLELKYQDLEVGYETAKKMLQNKRELLTQQGIINGGGSADR